MRRWQIVFMLTAALVLAAVPAKAASLAAYEDCLYKAADQRYLDDTYGFIEYTLYDVTADGVPECFVNVHDNKHSGILYIYTLKGNKTSQLASIEMDMASGESLLIYQDGFLEYYSYKGDESLTYHYFEEDGSYEIEELYAGYNENWRDEDESLNFDDFVDADEIILSPPMIPIEDLSYLRDANTSSFEIDVDDLELEEDLDIDWDELEGLEYEADPDIDAEDLFLDDEDIEDDFEEEEYVIPDSSKRYLTREELESFSEFGLRLARNEIYARHGRRFKNKTLQEYFDSCSWYKGKISPDDFDSSVFNKYESKNIRLIGQVERERTNRKKRDYTDKEILDMASYYYHRVLGKTYLRVEKESSDKDELTLHIYEKKEKHTATTDWLQIDKHTGTGSDEFGSTFDLVEMASLPASGYFFKDSNKRYLEYADIKGLSAEEMRIARNEIFARHGRRFKDKELQAYFDSCGWYDGKIKPDDFDESVLNKYEKKNVKLFKEYEK